MGKDISRRSFIKNGALVLGSVATTNIKVIGNARIESRKGLRQLSYMKEMKMGNEQYELVTLFREIRG